MKRAITFVLAAAMALSLAGCQQTPDSSIVTGKSSDALIEKAQGDVAAGSLAEKLGTPGTYQNSVSSEGGLLNVTIDASVTIPDSDTVPILQVTPGSISQEQADVLMENLVQSTLYLPDQPRTKDEVMEELLAAKQELAEGPSENDVIYQTEGQEAWEQIMQDTINQLNDEYQNAPETVEPEPISGTFTEVGKGTNQIEGVNNSTEVGFEGLRITNYPYGQGFSQAFYSRNSVDDGLALQYGQAKDIALYFPDIDFSQVQDVTITEDAAQELCDNVVQKLNIPGMSYWSISKTYSFGSSTVPTRCCWEVHYTRQMNGTPITYTKDSFVSVNVTSAGTYQVPWPYELLVFYVNDDGIVGMKWLSPYEIGDAVTEDSALLSFNDVMGIFEKMFIVDNNGLEEDVTINNIRLGYARILKQDETGVGLLVPVWDFFGTVKDAEGTVYDDPDDSLLTINAIDGSIIDKTAGY